MSVIEKVNVRTTDRQRKTDEDRSQWLTEHENYPAYKELRACIEHIYYEFIGIIIVGIYSHNPEFTPILPDQTKIIPINY